MYNEEVYKALIKVPDPDPKFTAWLVQINPPKKTIPKSTDPPLAATPESFRFSGYTSPDNPLDTEVPPDEYEDPIRWGFLLPPSAISYSFTTQYTEKNPLFGRIPYVRFNHAKALRITLSNVRLITPCNQYNLLPLITSLQELMVPPKFIPPPDPEIPIDEIEEPEETTIEEFYSIYARFPDGQYPPGYPGGQQQPGGQFPGNTDQPIDSQYPGGMGIPGGSQGLPQQGQGPGGQGPGGQQGNPEIPVEETETDPEADADKELKDEIEGIEPIEDPRIIDPPMLSLVLGKRTIQPIRLESIQVNENDLSDGMPTDITLTLNFIAITHPVLYQEPITPEEIIAKGTQQGTRTGTQLPTQINNLPNRNDPFDTGFPIF